MARCEVCGNDYDKSFEVVAAIHLMAPVCEHCGCTVVGHGTEVAGRFYCCAHCAKTAEHTDAVVDRLDALV